MVAKFAGDKKGKEWPVGALTLGYSHVDSRAESLGTLSHCAADTP